MSVVQLTMKQPSRGPTGERNHLVGFHGADGWARWWKLNGIVEI